MGIGKQARRHGGAFRGHSPKLLVPPPPCKREICSPSKDCAPKESNTPCAAGVHVGACIPQTTACALPSVSKVSLQDEKHEWTTIRSLKFRAEDLFLFSVYTPKFAGKNRDPHHKIPSRPARLSTCPPSPEWELSPKGGKRPVSTGHNLGFSAFGFFGFLKFSILLLMWRVSGSIADIKPKLGWRPKTRLKLGPEHDTENPARFTTLRHGDPHVGLKTCKIFVFCAQVEGIARFWFRTL